jgi:hypothetical protein
VALVPPSRGPARPQYAVLAHLSGYHTMYRVPYIANSAVIAK